MAANPEMRILGNLKAEIITENSNNRETSFKWIAKTLSTM